MAGATGLTFFHLHHCPPLIIRPCDKELAMAFGAFVHLKMLVVTEAGIIGKRDVLDGMAFAAVGSGAESCLTVMAGATGLPFFHISHGKAFPADSGAEDLIVAVVAFVHAKMEIVTELNLSNVLDAEGNVFGTLMAPSTARIYRKGHISLMTGAARSKLCHLRHVVAFAPCAAYKDPAVAVAASVDAQVEFVTEKGIGGLERNIFSCGMTLTAIAPDGKSGTAVVATAAGLALLHLAHGIALAAGAGNE